MDLRDLLFQYLDWEVIDHNNLVLGSVSYEYCYTVRTSFLGIPFEEDFCIDALQDGDYIKQLAKDTEKNTKQKIVSHIFFYLKPYLEDNHFAFLCPETGKLVVTHVDVLTDDEFHHLMEYRHSKEKLAPTLS